MIHFAHVHASFKTQAVGNQYCAGTLNGLNVKCRLSKSSTAIWWKLNKQKNEYLNAHVLPYMVCTNSLQWLNIRLYEYDKPITNFVLKTVLV